MSTKNNHDLVKQQSTKKKKQKEKQEENQKQVLLELSSEFEISKEEYEKYDKQSLMGYFYHQNAIWYVYTLSDLYYQLFICSKFEILRSYYIEHASGNEKCMDVRFYDKGDIQHVVPGISCSVLSKRNIDKLQSYGFSYNPKNVDEVIGLFIGQLFKMDNTLMTLYPGWRKEGTSMNFYGYDPNSYIGFPELSVSVSSVNNDEDIYLVPSEHISLINELIAPSVPAQMIVTVGLSSAVLGYLCVSGHKTLNSPFVHLHGESSTGKTTALRLAASMWGNPISDSGLLNTWNATSAKILENLSDNNGVVLTMNEFGSNMPNNDISKLIYNIAEGHGRDRMNNTNRSVSTWNTVILSCGESSILDSVVQSKGLYARIFEFFDLEITTSKNHADDINKTVSKNYGAIGSFFVEEIEKNQISITERYDELETVISHQIGSLSSISARIASLIAVFRLTAEIAKDIGLEIEPEKVQELFIDSHQKTIERLPSYETNLNKLTSYVVSNGAKFAKYKDFCSTGNYNGYIETDKTVFFDTAFENICKTLKIDSKLFLQDLKCHGYLDREPGRVSKRVKIGQRRVTCYCVYNEPHEQNDVSVKTEKKKIKRKKA